MLISLLIFLIVSSAVSLRQDKSILFSRIVINSLLFTSFIAINNLYIAPLEKGIGIYGGLFNVNALTQTFNIFVFLISAVILILTGFYPRKVYIKNFYSSLSTLLSSKLSYNKDLISNKSGEQFRIIEYALIIVFIICGAVFLISTGDLISIFLSIELQSYGLYILSTLYRDSESATASGLTYFLLGGLSSCFILLGSALLYANSGTTNLDNIYIIYYITEDLMWYDPLFIDLGLIIMLVGFLFKVSAAPFHFWSPDVYDGVPTIVTTYIAIVPKVAIFALFIDLFSHMMSFTDSWKIIFVTSSLLSFIIGSVLGLTQSRIKRLFAYSTISHVGFILLGLSADNTESIQASIFYIFQYTISNLNAFFILLSIGYFLYLYVYQEKDETRAIREKITDENNSPIQLISQIKGYFYVNSFISISLAVTLFSFIGVPPIAGFFAKQMILSAALDNNPGDNSQVFLVLVAILTSVIGAAYYLNLVKQIFFYKSDYNINSSINNITLPAYISGRDDAILDKKQSDLEKKHIEQIDFNSNSITINSGLSSTISIITLLLSLFIFVPEEWFNIVSILTLTLYK
jgi:NADH-ubiquinone oxidoreductase chain 2